MNTMGRRRFLGVAGAVAGGVVLGACGRDGDSRQAVDASDPAVARRDAARVASGRSVKRSLTAGIIQLDLAGQVTTTWAFDGAVPGSPLRAKVGDTVSVLFANQLPGPTTIHWHGLAIRNDMDGVPTLSQPPVPPGGTFEYRFVVPDAGTYWFHPHMGLGLDRGLYAALIVDGSDDPGDVEADEIIVLDDWLDGIDGRTPDSTYEGLRSMSMAGMGHMGGMEGMGEGPSGTGIANGSMAMASSELLGGDAGDVLYPMHLVNGRPPQDRPTLALPRGRSRLRFINAGSDTAYRVAVGGHALTVTHSDGFPVLPVETDNLLIGMGERYDVVVELRDGSWPLVAVAEGKGGQAEAVVRTPGAGASTPPPLRASPAELSGRTVTVADLRASESAQLPARPHTARAEARLQSDMMRYQWSIGARPFPDARPIAVTEGDRLQLAFRNESPMWHPMHLHGHTFRVGSSPEGPRKDTLVVRPREAITVEVEADNPGQWMLHCHNTYHLEAGMASVLSYVR